MKNKFIQNNIKIGNNQNNINGNTKFKLINSNNMKPINLNLNMNKSPNLNTNENIKSKGSRFNSPIGKKLLSCAKWTVEWSCAIWILETPRYSWTLTSCSSRMTSLLQEISSTGTSCIHSHSGNQYSLLFLQVLLLLVHTLHINPGRTINQSFS